MALYPLYGNFGFKNCELHLYKKYGMIIEKDWIMEENSLLLPAISPMSPASISSITTPFSMDALNSNKL